jgi:hypothetical protein
MQDDATVVRLDERGDVSRSRSGECFADEVAIDFPSIAPLSERLCERFLTSEAATGWQWTEVRLSPRDALSGGRFPLTLTLPALCERCGGRGESWQEPCESCGGSGARRLRRDVVVSLPSGLRDGARFLLTVPLADAGATQVLLQVSIP